MRSSNGVHDRVVFADDKCWVIGQSIRDAAVKRPTYIVERSGAGSMKDIYESLFGSSLTGDVPTPRRANLRVTN
jgi:hypothetical protein